jgi:hypothetical protein
MNFPTNTTTIPRHLVRPEYTSPTSDAKTAASLFFLLFSFQSLIHAFFYRYTTQATQEFPNVLPTQRAMLTPRESGRSTWDKAY